MLKLVAVATLLTVLAPLGAATGEELPPGGTFLDDDTSVHQGTIEAIAATGITRGCNPPDDTLYCPGEPVTRGQMAAFLVRALDIAPAPAAPFTDTAHSVFSTDIDAIAAAGITRGCNPPDNDQYCPSESVTRGQMAAFLARALDLPTATGDTFTDDTRSVFEADIERVSAAGITVGCNPPDNDHYCPDQPVTRGEMASFLARALHLDPVLVEPRPVTVDLISREEWGAAPPRGVFTPQDEIDHITIHHSGDIVSTTGPAHFRSWQAWHFHLGWPDIAYHFIIGRDGNVYEGRPLTAVGDTATEYDPTGHLLIVLEGDFDVMTPTDDQLERLAELVAWASLRFDVPLDEIAGHRDYAATTCPGDNLYSHIADGSIAARAAELIASGGVTLDTR
jgi:N-acetylmuramoyl-L-alanine amidase